MKILGLVFGGCASMFGVLGCGTYSELTPEAASVTATTSRPPGKCRSLGSLTGKGGGATGGYVSNESLVEYAINDLRNQAAALGATHVVYSTASMGDHEGTTTSAMIMGEALSCEAGSEPDAPAQRVAAKPAGCDYDSQCKGERVCVNRKCVDPAPAAKPEAATAAETKDAAPAPAAPAKGTE